MYGLLMNCIILELWVVLQCNNEIHDRHRVYPFFLKFRFCGFSYSHQNDFVLVFCQAKFEVRKTS